MYVKETPYLLLLPHLQVSAAFDAVAVDRLVVRGAGHLGLDVQALEPVLGQLAPHVAVLLARHARLDRPEVRATKAPELQHLLRPPRKEAGRGREVQKNIDTRRVIKKKDNKKQKNKRKRKRKRWQ